MITVYREGKQIRMDLEIHIPNYDKRILYLYWNCENAMFAGLLSSHIGAEIRDRIEAIRRQEYEHGYKDGRGKKAKKKWFRQTFRLD